jgi:sortase A
VAKKKASTRNRVIDIVRTALIVFALVILFYPVVANYLQSLNTTSVVNTYNKEVKTLSKAEVQEQTANAHRYNDQLYANSQHKVIPKGDLVSYKSVLNVDRTGIMAYISVPQIKINNLPIYHGVAENTLDIGLGHIPETSVPIGGNNTHSVISGHSGRANDQLFSDLDKLHKGDVFYIQVLNKKIKYQITGEKIVLPDDVSSLSIKPGQDLMTLVTCYPTGVNSHRLLVTGKRVPMDKVIPQEKVQRNTFGYNFWVMFGSATLAILAIIILIVRYILKRKKKKENEQKNTVEGGENK